MNISLKGKYVLLLCGFTMQHTLLFAQRLDSLLQLSLRNWPVLKQKQALSKSASASITELKHSFLPQVRVSEQLNIGSNNSIAGSLFTYGITPSSSAGVRADNTWQAATANVGVVYSEYELYNFGLNKSRIAYAQAQADLQESDLRKETYGLQLDVARNYFLVLRQQYRLAADQQNIERYSNLFTVIRALSASGLRAGADSSIAKAELARARISYQQVRSRLAQLYEQLSLLTGVPAANLAIDTASSQLHNISPARQTLLTDTSSHPLLDFYGRRADMLRRNEQVIRKSFLPKVLVSAATWARGSSIQYNDQFKQLYTGLGYQRFNYLAGITVTYNLLNGVYKKDRLAINRYQLEAADYEFQQQKKLIETAGRQATESLRMTEEILREIPVQLEAAQSAYLQKLAQYRAGIISLVDVVNAAFVLYRSQTDYIEAVTDWYLTRLDQAAATGTLSTFIQSLNR